MPFASYFAEGLVIISILSIELAGICCRASLPSKGLGLPSIKTIKFSDPLSETFPSISVVTEGTFSKTSTAVAPAAIIS